MTRRIFPFGAGLKTVVFLSAVLFPLSLHAAMTGICSDCHTMHNSQGGQPMANFAGETGVNALLLRGSCVGCHAQGGGSKTVSIGANQVPQVYHTDATDLAAGNFAYISGTKLSPGGADDSKGHNVVDVVNADGTHMLPPGFRDHGGNFDFEVDRFTCAGQMGCHGLRGQLLKAEDEFGGGETVFRTGLAALSGYEGNTRFGGAHHYAYDGKKDGGSHPDFGTNPLAHSYRFIRGMKGFGNETDRWQNVSSASHNEYYGKSGVLTNYSTAGCAACHTGGTFGLTSRLTTPNQTMTGFCVTCHGAFHSSGDGTSPFLRHPADYVIKNEGEYAAYTVYDVMAPAGRQVLPDAISNEVTPGSDVVMCLSCHMAHASPYPSMLRWDYTAMIAHDAGDAAGTGCFVCHSTKDD